MKPDDDIDRAVSHAVESGEDAEVSADSASSREEVYLWAYAVLLARFGTPDFPGGTPEVDWRARLDLHSPLLAVWDFDYYLLSLRLEGTRVLISRHECTSAEPAD